MFNQSGESHLDFSRFDSETSSTLLERSRTRKLRAADPVMKAESQRGEKLTIAGLFAGIGGLEKGLVQAGHRSKLLCEIDPGASRVLRARFPGIKLVSDVRKLRSLGRVDLVAAGFPCQDLSQAGRTAGIKGANSGLVSQIFRLLDERKKKAAPRWLLLENVSFMLQLDRGIAMRYLVNQLESRGFTWAYRVVDSRSFGLPQRRQRVILLASRTDDPRQVLFADDTEPREPAFNGKLLCGFYWTEGLRGLGWAIDAVPTLKGGSTIGIPSPPAIWDPAAHTVTVPEIRDAERLQGFDDDWTMPSVDVTGEIRRSHRWKLIGNAVSVPVASWVGQRLAAPGAYLSDRQGPATTQVSPWPKAAWGRAGVVHPVNVSMWPVKAENQHLSDFLRHTRTPLSARAASGFYSRALVSGLRFEKGFLPDVQSHIEKMTRAAVA
jgi:DNA (cytosine-5)-methyltransferase 1